MVGTATEPLTVLALGCGAKQTLADYHLTRVDGSVITADDARLITLDRDASVSPAIVCELGVNPIPLPDDSVHLVIAWHLIEHIGRQGESESWFAFWEELYRVMRPGGALQFECPYYSSLWAWADPTHVRPISEYTFLYMNQDAYRAPGSAIPRFRVRADFCFAATPDGKPRWELIPDYANPDVMAREPVSHIRGMLVARKPFRPWWEDRA